MLTCPVCDHAQPAGDECALCGHRLTGPGAEPAAVEPLADLEPTLQAPVQATADPVPGLEPTRLEGVPGAVGPVDGGPAAWAEPTRAGPVEAGSPEPVPGIERHRAEPVPDEGGSLDPLAPVVCRYCRATAMPGDKFCQRCGMRLPRFEPVRLAAQERGDLVCPDCGSLGPGPRCRRCGGRMVSPA
jgi:hypothetical protein